MSRRPDDLTPDDVSFLEERHLATLTTLSFDGRPHSVAIAFTYANSLVQILTNAGSQKVQNVERAKFASVCQVDGPRWLSLEGPAFVARDDATVRNAVAAFERRYRPTSDNPNRVIITINVERVLGRSEQLSA